MAYIALQAGVSHCCNTSAGASSHWKGKARASRRTLVAPIIRQAFRGGASLASVRRAITCTRTRSIRGNTRFLPRAENDGQDTVTKALSVAKSAVNTAANLVPESVPRPIAKGGVVTVAFGIALFALKAVLSTFFSILAIGALGVTLLTLSKGSKGDGGGGGDGDGGDDSLEEARRIMDKYK
eukprot:CAMPEP_0198211856 /NCGR_PEP_ID=MMETSP1445-20131203/25382_1 /TAXON_ID=36898 /ORGANISM="Pyramimonas sp., Strain CCMP2087" /LENGTH=181 /DNA_ID=CAMNT_0043886205 /DNA_START=113 /DNA_END=658 /DNA_ORIENTATION=+